MAFESAFEGTAASPCAIGDLSLLKASIEVGMAVFDKLHSRSHDGEAFLYAFDLLELDGEDWRSRSLEE